jgi:sterol desaturase/sphingolipid hydroxylase (fatty acid hydroxylase superfamily)
MQALWDSLVDVWPYSERLFFVTIVFLCADGFFWLANAFLYLCYHFNWFSKYRIQGQKFPEPALVKQALINDIISSLLGPFILYALYPIFKKWGMEVSGPIPSAGSIALQFLLFMVVNDTLFYWSHRLLHHRLIYKYIHKKHHTFKVNIGIAARYAHPVILHTCFSFLISEIFLGSFFFF